VAPRFNSFCNAENLLGDSTEQGPAIELKIAAALFFMSPISMTYRPDEICG
jgi:hypothetical protein